MKKISEEQMTNVSGGKFWATRWQCEPLAEGSSRCRCRKVYQRFWVKSYGSWNYGMLCLYDGTKA